MAEFRPMILTNKGQALIAKMMSGQARIQFIKIGVFENSYTDEQILEMTSTNATQTCGISRITRTKKSVVQIEGALTNDNVTTGYYMNTIALYALDPDEGEIIYSACGATVPGWIPAFDGKSTSGVFLRLTCAVSNSDKVNIDVDPGAVATIADIQDLQRQISDLEAFIGYTDNDIVGVEVNFNSKTFTRLAGATNRTPGVLFNSIQAFGGRKRCMMKPDGTILAYYGEEGYSETGYLENPTVTEKTYDIMVEQPKFYYKVVPLELEKIQGGKGYHMRKARYYISDKPKPGFKVHPAFIKDGVEKDFIYLSAYEGCTFNWHGSIDEELYNIIDRQDVDSNSDTLASIPNAKPTSGVTQNATRNFFRLLATSKGAGWSIQTIQSISATQLLFLIEYASFNIQQFLPGVVNKTDDGTTNMAKETGTTYYLGNETGITYDDDFGCNAVTYRGEENPFGNIFTWIDGINIDHGTSFKEGSVGKIYIADHNFSDNIGENPYKEIGFSSVYMDYSFISAFGYSEDADWLFYPTEGKGNSSLPVGDFGQIQNPGWKVVASGGAWNYGLEAGLFSLTAQVSSGTSARYIGGRLLYV